MTVYKSFDKRCQKMLNESFNRMTYLSRTVPRSHRNKLKARVYLRFHNQLALISSRGDYDELIKFKFDKFESSTIAYQVLWYKYHKSWKNHNKLYSYKEIHGDV